MQEVSKNLLLICIIIFCFACRSDRSKSKLENVTPLCDKRLYTESYMIFNNGALGGDRISAYLTDSINFRKYIGTFDNADHFYFFECHGDSVNVYYVKQHSPNNIILSTKAYSISNLKKDSQFDWFDLG